MVDQILIPARSRMPLQKHYALFAVFFVFEYLEASPDIWEIRRDNGLNKVVPSLLIQSRLSFISLKPLVISSTALSNTDRLLKI